MEHKFTIRVYGILIRDAAILLTQERYDGEVLIKFPGGGMEFGESPLSALKREFLEELNLPITVVDHLHTTETCVRSHFDPSVQVLCIYYLVDTEVQTKIAPVATSIQKCIWKPLSTVLESDLTFDTDRAALQKLKALIAE